MWNRRRKSEVDKQLTTHSGERIQRGVITRIQKEGKSRKFYFGSGSGGGRGKYRKTDDA